MKIFNRTKYKFNQETLQYEEIKLSFKRLILKLVPHSFASLIFGFVIMFLYIVVFESPEEKILRAENEYLKSNFKKMNTRLNETDKVLDDIAKRDNYIYRTTFQQDSIPFTVRNSGVGGSNRYKHLEGFTNTELVKDAAKKLDQMERKLDIQTLSYKELIEEVKNKQEYFLCAPVLQPIHVNELTRLSSFFGYRQHPVLGIVQFHKGIDLTAPQGTPVYASGDGVIVGVEKSNSRSGYGNNIIIDHGVEGLSTRYAHLYTIEVKKGQKVKRGERIGTVGNTGLSTAPHLHYEVLKNKAAVNPLRYMVIPTADEYEQIIKLAEYPSISFD
ncbi:MAG: M23 family metallopeptidase [Bacteroidales bacterium]|jgi:murein DD-endopeptidase MepM/ murein hydrolase activator NlpD|nr:M23 family metallopeptidase [Bacteroidales bacterium]